MTAAAVAEHADRLATAAHALTAPAVRAATTPEQTDAAHHIAHAASLLRAAAHAYTTTTKEKP